MAGNKVCSNYFPILSIDVPEDKQRVLIEMKDESISHVT